MVTPQEVLEIDWSKNGTFGDTGEIIAQNRIRSLSWGFGRDQSSQLQGRSIAGRLRVVLDNRSGDYSSFNTSSPLTGNVLPNRTLRLMYKGRAAQFVEANSEYLSIADNASLSTGDIDFTGAFWVNFDSLNGSQVAMSKFQNSGSNVEYRLYMPGNSRLRFQVSPDGTSGSVVTASPSLTLVTGRWYFVVFWHDASGNTINCQIDNGTVTSTAHSGGIQDGTAAFAIGRLSSGGSELDGRMVAAGFWKRVLTAAEKTFLYNNGNGRIYKSIGLTGNGSSLKTSLEGWWDLSEASGNRADSHGSNTLTDNNTVLDAEGIANYPAWQGAINRITPRPQINGNNVVLIEAQGPLGIVNQQEVSIAMQTTQRTDQLIDTILTDAGWSTDERTLATGKTTVNRYAADRKKTLTAMQEVEGAEAGFIRETKDGRIKFEDRHFRLAGDALTSQATFSDAGGASLPFHMIEQQDPAPFIFNQFEADVILYAVGSVAVLWTLSETGSDSPSIEVGQSKTFWARFPNPASATDAWAVDAWTTLVENTDYEANSQSGGGGTDMSTNIGVALSKLANAMKITLTNNGTVKTFITLLQARGTPVTRKDPLQISELDATSQTRYGERIWPSRSQYIPSSQEALDWANFHLSIYKDPNVPIRLSFYADRNQNLLNEMLKRDVSDLITVTANNDAGLGFSRKFFIERINYSRANPGAPLQVTMLLSDAVQASDFWVLGTSALGTQTRLAY